jgi:hypothetical protein
MFCLRLKAIVTYGVTEKQMNTERHFVFVHQCLFLRVYDLRLHEYFSALVSN